MKCPSTLQNIKITTQSRSSQQKTSFRSVLIFFANLLFSVSAEVCLGDKDAECDVKNDDSDDGRNDVSADRSGVPLKNDAQDENLWAQVNSYGTRGNVTTNHGRTLRHFAKYQVVKLTEKTTVSKLKTIGAK
jgi:hypothetical protein